MNNNDISNAVWDEERTNHTDKAIDEFREAWFRIEADRIKYVLAQLKQASEYRKERKCKP